MLFVNEFSIVIDIKLIANIKWYGLVKEFRKSANSGSYYGQFIIIVWEFLPDFETIWEQMIYKLISSLNFCKYFIETPPSFFKLKNMGKNYFSAAPFFGRRRKFESPISRLRKVVQGLLKKQNVWKLYFQHFTP